MHRIRMGPLLVAAILAAGGTVQAFVQDEGAEKDPAAVFSTLQGDYRKAASEARDSGDADSKLRAVNEKYLPRFLEFAKAHRGSQPGMDASVWALHLYQALGDERGFDAFFETALSEYGDRDEAAARLVPAIQGRDAEKKLRKVLETSKNPEVKAAALFSVGNLDWNWGQPESGAVPKVRSAFETVVREYPATKAARRAKGNLFELDHLQVGMTAPDVSFVDADGKERRLADLRGKTVLLDFWASW
jgi:hypothetical protein